MVPLIYSARHSELYLHPNSKPSQIGTGGSGPESAPRGSKSITFAKGIFQPFHLPKFLPNPIGNLRFYLFNIRYTGDTKLQLEKFSKSEVGVFWAAAQYRFRNLWFKHRGTNFEMFGSSIGVPNMVCYIPLCLNRKFRNPYRGATQNNVTPTSNSENFKLQLGVIDISDIEWVKRKDPLLDS